MRGWKDERASPLTNLAEERVERRRLGLSDFASLLERVPEPGENEERNATSQLRGVRNRGGREEEATDLSVSSPAPVQMVWPSGLMAR